MTTQEIQDTLSKYIVKQMKRPRPLQADTPLLSSGLIDSFHLVDLAVFVEEQYGVQIEDSELNADTFDTLAQLTALVEERLG